MRRYALLAIHESVKTVKIINHRQSKKHKITLFNNSTTCQVSHSWFQCKVLARKPMGAAVTHRTGRQFLFTNPSISGSSWHA